MSEPALTGSVSVWITGMKRGDQDAIASLCERYLAKLSQVAKRKLGPSTRGICDGDDIARWTLMGATVRDMTLMMGVLPRTVRRKQELIRLVWSLDFQIQSRR